MVEKWLNRSEFAREHSMNKEKKMGEACTYKNNSNGGDKPKPSESEKKSLLSVGLS